MDPMLLATVLATSKARKDAMSPPGAIGLEPLLDKRRLEFGIPDNAFSVQPYLDRILVWQMARDEGKQTFGNTGIHMADTTAEARKDEAPRGILLAAGLEARDRLTSHGIHLGHMVIFLRAAPFRLRTGWTGARENKVIILQSGDVVGSEDLRASILAGDTAISATADEGGTFHHYTNHPHPLPDEHPEDY